MTPDDYAKASVISLLRSLDDRLVTSQELVELAIARIESADKTGLALNAITGLFADEARLTASRSDEKRARGAAPGRLEGIPVLIKDNIDVAGWPTTAGSVALEGIIASQDAPLITRLRQEGAILLGKTAMHELAAGITGASSLTGFTQNALLAGYSPGGSSSGSAVAVAAGYVPLAIGTDTAGSVRIPAAFNNLYGLRGTRGSIAMQGIVPLSPTQDIAGPLVRNAGDLWLAAEILAGNPIAPFKGEISAGLLDAWFTGTTPENADIRNLITQATDKITRHAGKVSHVEFPDLEQRVNEANVIAYEFAESLEQFLALRTEAKFKSLKAIYESKLYHPQLDAVFKSRAFHKGTSSGEYAQALEIQKQLYGDLERFFAENGINILIYPVVRHPPVKIGEQQEGSNALLSAVTGAPALSIPVGFTKNGFPVGMELLTLKNNENILIRAASVFSRCGSTPAF
ncbi:MULTISPECIES: amidase [Rahnella]|uniref:Amidase n=1 Tax=Rahnella laticis TaxID=2787622 RepID=A0ABS0E3P2_9GAMM|nr:MULTISPECIES: amidase [Rahnella]MBF7978600.1 amidase [Rahnella laticis]MBF7998690.1 amidase [Rahnella sp. LAC-M12]